MRNQGDAYLGQQTEGALTTPNKSAGLRFAQAILDRPIRPPQKTTPGAPSRELLEWLAKVSDEYARQLESLRRREREALERQEHDRRLLEFVALIEGNWDPSKHPRGAFAQNRGWFSPTGGTGVSSSDSYVPPQSTAYHDLSAKPADTEGAKRGGIARHFAPPAAPPETPKVLHPGPKHRPERAQHAQGEPAQDSLGNHPLLTYFSMLYGEKGQRLLTAFLKSGGAIKVEGLWFGNSALDTRNAWRPNQIRVHQGLDPASAARELMERLIEASGLTEVRQHLDHSGFENIDALIGSYRQSVKKAAAFASLASQLYLSGVSIVSEGADWVITIHELSEGNYQAAIGLLPLLPAVVGKTGVILKHGDQTLRISAESARRVRAPSVNRLIEMLQSTQSLVRNMHKAGIVQPRGTAAHHIVPSAVKGPAADQARAVLRKFGIDQHNAANGVFLPTTLDSTVGAALHGYGVHSPAYCAAIWSRLKNARSKQEAIIILDQIRNELLAGTFRY